MKIFFVSILSFCFICCVPYSKSTVESAKLEPAKVDSTRKKLSEKEWDIIEADIDKRLSSYIDWWNRIYKSDTLLYQSMMECVYVL